MRTWLVLVAVSSLTACATLPDAGSVAGADRCRPSLTSFDSRAGRAWLRDNGWRFADRDQAAEGYRQMFVAQPSPWPAWFTPMAGELAVGTRLQMALAPGQAVDRPGGFATYDYIGSVRDVRNFLAVRSDWKPKVASVVTRPLPVCAGPIGPQVDPGTCRLLPGRWYQVEMTVPAAERMTYLRPVGTPRPIK